MGRKHPLDVFRSTGNGFEKASRKRRTVQGKVIASSVRQRAGSETGSPKRSASAATSKSRAKPKATSSSAATRAARPSASARGNDRIRVTAPTRPKAASTSSSKGSPAAAKAASAAKSRRLAGLFTGGPARSPSARKADGATRNLFYGAVVLLAVLALVIVFQQTWLDSGPGELPRIPIKKMEEVLPPGPGGPQPSSASDPANAGVLAPEWFTIQASVYNGSEKGLALAFAAQNELIVRGLPDVTVIGHEGDEPGTFDSYELIVGYARTRAALEATLDRMLSIDDWPGGARAPFLDARIVAHPQPAGLED